MPNYFANRGTIDCYGPIAVPRPATPFDAPGYKGEANVVDASGDAEIVEGSPSEYTRGSTLKAAVVINQNFYSGWWTDVGKIVEHQGLLAVKLDGGRYELSLRYLPLTFVPGTLVTLITVSCGIWSVLTRDNHRSIFLPLAVF